MSAAYTDVPPDVDDPDEWLAEQELRTRQRALFLPGSTILDAAAVPEPVWGTGSDVLASRGEPMIVTGGIGAGKTTLFANLTRARIGLTNQVLGYPVEEGGRVLYLACDRPRQIMRNLRRRFTEQDRGRLDERLIVWKGPLPRDLGTHPQVLREMCAAHDLGPGDTVIIDGLKDVARDLTKDETGSAVNNSFQLCVRDGIDVWVNHHQRKAQNGQGAHKPKTLADMYGSTWIGAGAGTVLLMWAERPGAAFVELSTLKPAADDIGPLNVHHDLDTGAMVVMDGLTVQTFLTTSLPQWSSISDVLTALGGDAADDNQRDRIRRTLGKLARDRLVETSEQPRLDGGKAVKLYRWIGPR